MAARALIVILGMGVFLATPAAADVPARKLGVYGYNHDLAADATGAVHMLWKSSGQSEVSYGRLVNGAVQTVDAIPGSGKINDVRSKPRLSVRADGSAVHTSWCTPDYAELYHAWRDGGGWHTERVWASAGSQDRCAEPVVGAAPDGTLHLIFQMWDASDQLPSRLTYYRRPAAGAWQEIGVVSPAKKNPEYRDTAIAIDAEGGAHLGFTTMYRYVSPQGVLGPEEKLPFRPGATGSCCGDLFVDATGTVHYPQADWPLDTVDYTYKPKGGAFVTPEQVSQTACSSGYGYEKWPAVVAGADGKVYITWAMPDCAAKTTPFVHLAVRDPAGAWTQVMLDSDADIHARGKTSMAASGAFVHVIWRDADGEIVLYSIDTGAALPDGGTPDSGADAGGVDGGTGDAGVPVTGRAEVMEDHSVHSWQPDTHVPDDTVLNVGGTVEGQYDEGFYLKFSPVVPPGHRVVSARIWLYCDLPSSPQGAEGTGGSIFSVADDSWSEKTISWSNKPAWSGQALGTIPHVTRGEWYSFDVPAAVTAADVYSFAVMSTDANGGHYLSKEGGAGSGKGPYMEFTTVPVGDADGGKPDDTGVPQDSGVATDTGTKADAGAPPDAGMGKDAGGPAPTDAGKTATGAEPFEYDTVGCGCSSLGI